MDLYKTLNIAKNANKLDIKKAYRKLAHKWHPDKHNGDAQVFATINKAYTVLIDDKRRNKYDKTGSTNKTDIKKVAKDNTMGLFLQIINEKGFDWLENNDIVSYMINTIQGGIKNLDMEKKKLIKEEAKLNKLVNRITHKKSTPNIFDLIIAQKKKESAAKIDGIEIGIESAKEGIKLLNEYKDTKVITRDKNNLDFIKGPPGMFSYNGTTST